MKVYLIKNYKGWNAHDKLGTVKGLVTLFRNRDSSAYRGAFANPWFDSNLLDPENWLIYEVDTTTMSVVELDPLTLEQY